MIVILERRPSVPSSPDEEKLRELGDKLANSVGEIEKPQPKGSLVIYAWGYEREILRFILRIRGEQ